MISESNLIIEIRGVMEKKIKATLTSLKPVLKKRSVWLPIAAIAVCGLVLASLGSLSLLKPGESTTKTQVARAATNTFITSADTLISTAAPNKAVGGDIKMVVCGNGAPVCTVDNANEKRSLVKFVVSGISGTPTSVKLRYYVTTASVPSMQVKKVTSNTWLENTLTWNNGGSSLPTDSATYTSPAGAAKGWYEADVTGAVTGDGTYSFVITNPTTMTTRLATKETTTPAGTAPQLIVNTDVILADDPTVAAAGDISTRTKTGGNKLTSDLVLSLNPDRVITLGDNQYTEGSLADFNNFYNVTWGRFKDKTYPIPAHHEYYSDTTATGYYTYFGSLATPRDPSCTSNCEGYYSFDLGDWHFVALNTNHKNCLYVACGPTSAQVNWLKSDLAANTKPCVAAYMGDPRWSSGTKHGSNVTYDAIWDALYDVRADLVLDGHEHFYERFAKQNSDGQAVPDGIRQITVGTGGNGALYPFGTPLPNSEVRNNTSRGVLLLTLHDNSYDWSFKPIPGNTFTDSGTNTCN